MKDILLMTLLHGSFNVGWHVNFGECSLIYSTDIGFEEASSFWSVQFFFFFLFFIGHSTGSKPTGTDRNGPNFRIGQ